MKRTFAIISAVAVAVAVFAWLVHSVLIAAGLAEPAAVTVNGLTMRRLWATTAAAVAVGGVLLAAMGLRSGARNRCNMAMTAGLFGAVNGWLNLAFANGGPGTRNGVVGGAAALVLGLVSMGLGGWGKLR